MSKKVLVLGASGMLGNAVIKALSNDRAIDLNGTVRGSAGIAALPTSLHRYIHQEVNVEDFGSVVKVFDAFMPEIVINCVGIIKQLSGSYDPLVAISINSLLPHTLAKLCLSRNVRLIHMSTDCIFSGKHGGYLERDFPDANDLYGRSKYLGEVDYPGCVTLRTSIIGHELNSANSLIDWFLSQDTSIKGYTKAIFSGLPTNEMANVIHNYVIPNPDLRGVYHVSEKPISKFDLLKLVANVYGKSIDIIPDDSVSIDRSLNSEKFSKVTGYKSKPWPQLIEEMYHFRRFN